MSNVIMNDMYPYITKNLDKTSNRDKIRTIIMEFIDDNSDALMSSAVLDKVYITDSLRKKFYDIMDVDPKKVHTMITNIPLITESWKALKKNDLAFVMLCNIIYYHRNNYTTDLRVMNLFLGMHAYAIYVLELFRYIQYETMIYTVNNLSNKHDLKKYGTVFNVINKKVQVIYDTYKDTLRDDDDELLIKYVGNTNTRFRQWVKGLMLEYKKNKDSGKYFNTETDNYEEDDYKETSNMSMGISRIVEKTTTNFFTKSVDMKALDLAARLTKISKSTLFSTLKDIKDTTYHPPKKQIRPYDHESHIELLKKLVGDILTIFIVVDKNDIKNIKSMSFINSILLIYGRSNTIDAHSIEIKNILDELLIRHNDKYSKTNRVATKINWRKAIFIYYGILIQKYS